MDPSLTPDAGTTAESASNHYQNLFHPRSIAVVGASSNPLKPGGRVLKSIQDHGYRGELWAVNPKAREIFGVTCYPIIAALPQAPDLALVAIPAAGVLTALQDLARLKSGAVMVLSAGFGEKDVAGKALEQELCRVADSAGIALIGPNCSGFLTPSYKGKFAGIIPRLPGCAVDFISGSGAMVDYLMEGAEARGLSFGTVVNLGNSVQMGVEDLVELYDENYGPQQAKILLLYLESLNKPAKLLIHARSLARKGCALIAIKSGATAEGERAAASHTGAVATRDSAVTALFAKAGIIRVSGRGEMIDVACVLHAARGRLKGKRICIVTDAGGPGVMFSDELSRQGLELPLLKPETQRALAQILPPESATANPVDALPSRSAEQISGTIHVLAQYESDAIDLIAVLTGDSGLSDNAGIYQVISRASGAGAIPLLPVLSSVTSCRAKIGEFIAQGHVFFPDEVELGRALGKVARWRLPESEVPELNDYDTARIRAALEGREGPLPPATVRQVLTAAGFRLPRQIEIFQQDKLTDCCREIGYPLVMKVIGPLHKTDVGGVKPGIAHGTQALDGWNELMKIDGALGVLLQPHIPGSEVILGASREGRFGHLLMVGLGGIYAEVLKDFSFALAPVGQAESQELIRGLRSFPLLEGVRGQAGMDLALLADQIQRLGRLVTDFPQIKELDLNPLKGSGRALVAVDARIVVAPIRN